MSARSTLAVFLFLFFTSAFAADSYIFSAGSNENDGYESAVYHSNKSGRASLTNHSTSNSSSNEELPTGAALPFTPVPAKLARIAAAPLSTLAPKTILSELHKTEAVSIQENSVKHTTHGCSCSKCRHESSGVLCKCNGDCDCDEDCECKNDLENDDCFEFDGF